ncbi:MAG: hypothetical protein WDO69_33845 [Pseudomonadota bacterium]
MPRLLQGLDELCNVAPEYVIKAVCTIENQIPVCESEYSIGSKNSESVSRPVGNSLTKLPSQRLGIVREAFEVRRPFGFDYEGLHVWKFRFDVFGVGG